MMGQRLISKFIQTTGPGIACNLLIPNISMVLRKPSRELLQFLRTKFGNFQFNLLELCHWDVLVESHRLFNILDWVKTFVRRKKHLN